MPPRIPPSTPPGIPPSTPPTSPPSSLRSIPLSGWIPTGISVGTVKVGPVVGTGFEICAAFAALAAGGGGGGGGEGTGAAATNAIIEGTSGSLSLTENSTTQAMLPSIATCVATDSTVADACESRKGLSIVPAVRSNMVASVSARAASLLRASAMPPGMRQIRRKRAEGGGLSAENSATWEIFPTADSDRQPCDDRAEHREPAFRPQCPERCCGEHERQHQLQRCIGSDANHYRARGELQWGA